jgi:hypothetical protein
MKYVISRYNHNLSWLLDYTDDFVLYDRSPILLPKAIPVPNVGSDIYDKLTFIIDNYDNLPSMAIYTKANLFDYIKPREFEKIKDNQTFTPILSQDHHTYLPVCYYKEKMYYEINNLWFTTHHPCKNDPTELMKLLGIHGLDHVPFAPGSNYILPKATILKHPKSFYEKLRSYLDWAVYPGEAMIIERGLYTIWKD